jgi:hypothetical protein
MVLDNRRQIALLLLVFMALITTVFYSYTYFGQAGLEAVSVIVSASLTLALVVLYWQQHRALRFQQEPQLEVTNIEMIDNFEKINLDTSNFGGGSATSMKLRIELYELSGHGPVRTSKETLRRIEPVEDGVDEKTRASSIQPSELNIEFQAISRTVIGSGTRVQEKKSLSHKLVKELEDRDVIYGRLTVEYDTLFSNGNVHDVDFSLKFTHRDKLEYEPMDFLPWEEKLPEAE